MRSARLAGAIALGPVALLLALPACGGGDEPDAPGTTLEGLSPEDPGPVHVHGLGVNPADGALFIATHTGLYQVTSDEQKASRVGDGYQDTMGFAVAGPNHFLGSGHPDARELQRGSPPLLGLIESRDAGRTWKPISLLGEADFHVLRFAGDRVYGYDASNGRLLVSDDRGKTWEQGEAPGHLIDLAADPENRDHLLAAAGGGLFNSEDGGRTWQRLGLAYGLLAWPSEQTLYLLDGAGTVFVSRDAGGSFTPVGELGAQPAALVAEDEGELYAALHDGTIEVSRDGGRTWGTRSTP